MPDRTDNTTSIRLCDAASVRSSGLSFTVQHAGQQWRLFVLPHADSFVAYVNQCPHTGVNLDWQPHQFLDTSGEFIQCSTHGARFQIDDGYCVSGPCLGQSLRSLPIRLKQGWIHVMLPGVDADS